MIIKQKEPNMTNYIITQQDKELVLRYLSMALLSGVKCQTFDDIYAFTLLGIDGDVLHIDCPVYDEGDGYYEVDYCKPYLRPMSSMTTDEEYEYHQIRKRNSDKSLGLMDCNDHLQQLLFPITVGTESIIWLLNNHFDIFGLIPKGLAIEVTEENNPYK